MANSTAAPTLLLADKVRNRERSTQRSAISAAIDASVAPRLLDAALADRATARNKEIKLCQCELPLRQGLS
jgi:hypothetical protein